MRGPAVSPVEARYAAASRYEFVASCPWQGIDTELLDAPVVVENLDGGDGAFPTSMGHC
jgi:hypothetical protein